MEKENQDRAKIIEFADQYLAPYKLKRKPDGSEEIIPQLCPFCHGGSSGDKETFAFSIDKGIFVCKRGSCGKRGRFPMLAEYVGSDITVSSPSSILKKKETQYVLPDTKTFPPTEEIYQFFEKRKISRETVDAFHIASDQDGMIVFRFFVDGVNVYEKFRRPWKLRPGEKGKEWAFSGAKPVLWGMDDCSFYKPLVITEGQIDAMSLYEAGIQNVVSVPSGCENLGWIDNCWDWLEKFDTIILFGDADEPGQRMVQNVSKRLDEQRCMIVEDYPKRPDGTICKDANEILYFHGWADLVDMVESAKSVPIKGLIDLSEITPQDPTMVPRVKTNIPMLDEVLGGLTEGGVTVFSGKAGDGKSTLSGLLLLNAVEQGYNVCAYSGELRKEKFQEWINLQCAGSDYITLKYDPIREKSVPVVPYVVQQRLMDYYRGRFFLFDNNEVFDREQTASILSVFTLAARRYGCKLFLIDNLMTSLSDTEDELAAQKNFVVSLKNFANKYKAHVLLVAHPRKTKAGEPLGKDDVGGNSAIVNLADSGVVVERPNLRIIKNREGGIQKLIECCYCPDSRRIFQAKTGDCNHFSWDKTGIEPFKGKDRADSLEDYKTQAPPPDEISRNMPF